MCMSIEGLNRFLPGGITIILSNVVYVLILRGLADLQLRWYYSGVNVLVQYSDTGPVCAL